MALTDAELKKKLTPEQYAVMRQKGTVAPFSGALLHNKKSGSYDCAACEAELFSSQHKFDSNSGWPSFYDLKNKQSIKLVDDTSLDMHRVEVTCAACGSHLGHVFHDAPDTPTGLRYCINSVALDFTEKK